MSCRSSSLALDVQMQCSNKTCCNSNGRSLHSPQCAAAHLRVARLLVWHRGSRCASNKAARHAHAEAQSWPLAPVQHGLQGEMQVRNFLGKSDNSASQGEQVQGSGT